MKIRTRISSFYAFLMSTDGSHREKIIRSGYWLGSATFIAKLSDLTRSIVLARLLTPDAFGIMSIVLIASNGIDIFTQFNFKAALIHKQDNIEESMDTAWVLNILRGFVLFACIYLSAPYIAYFYKEPIISTALRIYSGIVLLNGFVNINMLLFDKALDFKKLAFLRICISTSKLLVSVALALLLRNIYALVYSAVLAVLIELLLSYSIQRKRPRFRFRIDAAKSLFSYSIFISGIGILLFITVQIDDALIGSVLGMTALGYYTYAYKLANLPSSHISGVLSQVLFPAYSSIQHDIDYMKSIFLKALKFISFISIPLSVGLYASGDMFVYVFLGKGWMPIVSALRILCIFGALRSIGSTTSPVFQATGKPNILFNVMLIKLTLILAIIYPLTYYFGIEGAAWSVTLPMIIEQFFLWRMLSGALQLTVSSIAAMLKTPVIGSAAMLLAMHLTRIHFSYNFIDLFLYVLLGLLVYGAATFLADKHYYKELLRTFSLNREAA